ncbi:MAG: phosphoenolpyruvate--protein phosphotransferase [Proteobacteria bacterium]|nr:MAG: phosphoenolpyruvate--protein phosphotransferase [Pseudomonadota bacterium]
MNTVNKAMYQQTVVIPNPLGFHARPATQLSKLVKTLEVAVFIENNAGKRADTRKMFKLLGLALSQGDEIKVISESESAVQTVVEAIKTGLGDDLNPEAETSDTNKQASNLLWEPTGDIICHQGVSASDGLVIGKIRHYRQQHFELPNTVGTVKEETENFRHALNKAKAAIKAMMRNATDLASEDQTKIFEAHLALLDDKDMLADTLTLIAQGENAAKAYKTISDARIAELSSVDNANIAARATDIRDIRNQVMQALLDIEIQAFDFSAPVIICAEDLTPSDTTRLNPEQVLAFITALGGPTSHSAILARGMGMPAVVALGDKIRDIPADSTLVVDGHAGRVYVNPSDEQLASAQQAKEQLQANIAKEQARRMEAGQTKDGTLINISANVNSAEAIPDALELGAEGVGLMRTEFLYLESDCIPSEAVQEKAYRDMAAAMRGKPLIIRTLDIGGDKEVDYLGLAHEDNAFLGVRGIRLCFERPDLFKPQLRAICRVAKDYANIHVMFPMIGKSSDWERAKKLLDDIRQEIGAPEFPVGVMIEVPSAALLADSLAEHVDFFSVGTNDLTQYTLAMDRMHPVLANQADAVHPAVLKLIEMTAKAAEKHGKWVGVCGGAAGDKDAAKLLIGLGVRELSVPAPQVASIKATLRQYTLAELQELAQKALTLGGSTAVRKLLKAHQH